MSLTKMLRKQKYFMSCTTDKDPVVRLREVEVCDNFGYKEMKTNMKLSKSNRKIIVTDKEDIPIREIIWNGISFPIKRMLKEGWNITAELNIYTNKVHLKCREPYSKMLLHAKIWLSDWEHSAPASWKIDCATDPDYIESHEIQFCQEHNARVTAPKSYIEGSISKEDIPWMLDTIAELQRDADGNRPVAPIKENKVDIKENIIYIQQYIDALKEEPIEELYRTKGL